jgi:hypothetical protein
VAEAVGVTKDTLLMAVAVEGTWCCTSPVSAHTHPDAEDVVADTDTTRQKAARSLTYANTNTCCNLRITIMFFVFTKNAIRPWNGCNIQSVCAGRRA